MKKIKTTLRVCYRKIKDRKIIKTLGNLSLLNDALREQMTPFIVGLATGLGSGVPISVSVGEIYPRPYPRPCHL